MLVTALGKVKGHISVEKEREIIKAMQSLPAEIEKSVSFDTEIEV